MKRIIISFLIWLLALDSILGIPVQQPQNLLQYPKIKPKAFILNNSKLMILEKHSLYDNFSVVVISIKYVGVVYCTSDYSICEIRLKSSLRYPYTRFMELSSSQEFDLSQSYFLFAGVSYGYSNLVSERTTIFADHITSVKLDNKVHRTHSTKFKDYKFDNPQDLYSIKIFKLNEKLRDRALELANIKNPNMTNSASNVLIIQDKYNFNTTFINYIQNYTKEITNKDPNYGSIAQYDRYDSEYLPALLWMSKYQFIDFERVLMINSIMAELDPLSEEEYQDIDEKIQKNILYGNVDIKLTEISNACFPVINDIINNWDLIYRDGKQFKEDDNSGLMNNNND
ncbi:hypothetical protein DFJ63DRAFT_314790 [Scheffersomyces coipomensis]|uniref:uncharacterized protein n=1 Tax=Scheffersomyces coipomensis TaxID=1788519 RepID=UPI00315CA1C3